MERNIRIGTRSSELALWQATTVADQLEHLGYQTEIVKIDSIGDAVLNKPLYELGTTGVFTKNLDIALLNEQIDIAVHSLKDVPTQMPNGIVQAAVLKRGQVEDVLVLKDNEQFFSEPSAVIATGSLRRQAQWLYRYPEHRVVDLRGNVNTRLKKLRDNDWNGAIFAKAGLKRIGLLPKNHISLDWMIPAPAQGAVMVATLEKDEEIKQICAELNDEDTALCVDIERRFLNKLEGGCSAPIGALAKIINEQIVFKGVLFSIDGSRKIEFSKTVSRNHADLPEFAAQYILDRGGKKLMRPQGTLEKNIYLFSTKNLSIGQMSAVDPMIGIDMSDFISIRYQRIKASSIKRHIKHAIFTSQNAVTSLLESVSSDQLDFGAIYCVGRRTKKLIEQKIGKVSVSKASADKLADHLLDLKEIDEVTFFCGEQRLDLLPDKLSGNGIQVEEIHCYQTLATPNKLAKDYAGLLFFSPSGVESFLQMNQAENQVAFCIGATTAAAAKKHFDAVIESKSPSVESVLEAVNTHYSKQV